MTGLRFGLYLSLLLFLNQQTFGADCFNLQELLTKIPANTLSSVKVTSATIDRAHGIVDLANKRPETFVERGFFVNEAAHLSAIGTKFRTGRLVSDAFLSQLKKEFSFAPLDQKDPRPRYSVTRAQNTGRYDEGSTLFATLFRYTAVDVPYGRINDNTVYPVLVEQRGCSLLHAVGLSEPNYKIESSTENSLVYSYKDSGEGYRLTKTGNEQAGQMTLERLKYVVTPHQCEKQTIYETHPVAVRYEMKWGPDAKVDETENLEIKDQDDNILVKGVNSDQICKSKNDDGGEKPNEFTKLYNLPVSLMRVEFGEGKLTENSLLAKGWLTAYLGKGFLERSLTEKSPERRYSFISIDLSKEQDPAQLALGLERLEKGKFPLRAEAKICRELGHYSDLDVEFLRRHPELTCIQGWADRDDRHFVDGLTSKATEAYNRLEKVYEITGIPLVLYKEVSDSLVGYVRSNSSDKGFLQKNERGELETWRFLSVGMRPQPSIAR